jgi:hypothetical protein
MACGDIKTIKYKHTHCFTMTQPDAFALIITSTLISVGVASSLSQMAVVLTLYGKYGFMVHNQTSGDTQFHYLSDTFALDPGMANTWLIAMIPSVAVASIVITTSINRVWKYSRGGNNRFQFWNVLGLATLWSTVLMTQIGLMMLVLYNIVWKRDIHLIGVLLSMFGGFTLNGWVILLDYGVTRRRWHPQIIFDVFLLCTTICSMALFFQSNVNTSVTGEWILIVVMWVLHILLPFRGARIVLSPPRAQGCIVWDS